MRLSAAFALACSAAVFLVAAAQADVKESSNWSGFAVHRSGVHFKRVSAAWTQPSAHCTPGQRTFSSFWIGLGGFSLHSPALEQIGTEIDCTGSGAVRSSAWYELVPAPSRAVHMPVHPGDRMTATVAVQGHVARLWLTDQTTGSSFQKTVHVHVTDVNSAEWIVEAPSLCMSASSCQTLPLANFGAATFSRAQAVASSGRRGTISGAGWRATKIRLLPGGTRYVVAESGGLAGAEATPSRLGASGSQFTVTYSQPQLVGAAAKRARSASLSDGYVVH